jgi:hypothetical protein
LLARYAARDLRLPLLQSAEPVRTLDVGSAMPSPPPDVSTHSGPAACWRHHHESAHELHTEAGTLDGLGPRPSPFEHREQAPYLHPQRDRLAAEALVRA